MDAYQEMLAKQTADLLHKMGGDDRGPQPHDIHETLVKLHARLSRLEARASTVAP